MRLTIEAVLARFTREAEKMLKCAGYAQTTEGREGMTSCAERVNRIVREITPEATSGHLPRSEPLPGTCPKCKVRALWTWRAGRPNEIAYECPACDYEWTDDK